MTGSASNVRQDISDSAFTSASSTNSFLDAITIEHGPRALLGRLFLKAVSCAEARGVSLRLCTLNELETFFQEQMKDWPTMPVFKPEYQPREAGLTQSFAILGEDIHGNVVATQAARFFDWSETTLKAEVESMRMLYDEKRLPAHASAEVTANHAGRITGRVVYSGSTWFNPEYRKRQLSAILPRISRCLALTKWNVDTTISFMDWRIVEKGVAASYGYDNLEASVTLRNVVDPEFVAAIGWITRDELLQDAEWFLRQLPDQASGRC
ncbi:MAG: hypothetical protein R3D57_00745 [Hyphomicrobiaceae bacterium]